MELASAGSAICSTFHPNKRQCTITTDGEAGRALSNEFTFDRVFDVNSNQKEVYMEAAKPIIDSVIDGFNGTVFAYGQTGSGKTFTMQGPDIENLEM